MAAATQANWGEVWDLSDRRARGKANNNVVAVEKSAGEDMSAQAEK